MSLLGQAGLNLVVAFVWSYQVILFDQTKIEKIYEISYSIWNFFFFQTVV